MAFSANINKLLTPLMKSMILDGSRTCLRSSNAAYSCIASNKITPKIVPLQQHYQMRQLGSDPVYRSSSQMGDEKPLSFAQVLDHEIQEEVAELNQRLTSDQFPGFSVETDDSDVKLTKQVGDSTVVVRFSVSSSLSEWRSDSTDQDDQQSPKPSSPDQQQVGFAYSLLSLPDFQVQIIRNGRTFEVSCYFEELEHDEETGEPYPSDPVFHVDEVVLYEGEPKDTEFAVSTEYFRDELQDGLFQYLSEHGIDDEFSKNLVSFATNYEKKQYIGLMKRLKEFVAK